MHAQWNRLTPIMALWLVAGTALAQDNPRRQPPVAPTHDTRPGLADYAPLLVRPPHRIGPAHHPDEGGPVPPAGTQTATRRAGGRGEIGSGRVEPGGRRI